MKSLKTFMILMAVAAFAAACGGAAESQPEATMAPAAVAQATPATAVIAQNTPAAASAAPQDAAPADAAVVQAAPVSAELSEDYDDALSTRNQLAFGTLKLETTAEAVTSAQAAQLLPLWQALNLLDASTTAAPEEVAAVQNQIVAAMTTAQIAAIAQMQLTNTQLQAYYVEIGVSEEKTPEPGVTPQSGSMRSVPTEQRASVRATAQALGTPVGAGNNSSIARRSALLDKVIQLLADRAAQ